MIRRLPATARFVGLTVVLALLPGLAWAQPLRIVATIPPYAMLARAIAGEEAQVHTLLRRGHDPHHYEPSALDLARLRKAHLVISNGIGQQRLEAPLARLDGDSTRVRMADAVAFDPIQGSSGALNAHIWLDPDVMARGARVLSGRLSALRPAARERFRANGQAFREAVSEADRRNEELLADLPTRHLITFHPGFDYFFRHYRLEVAATYLDLAGNEPGPRRVADILEKIRDLGVPAIFREPQLPAAPAEALAEEASVRVGVLDPLGYTDAVTGYPDLLTYNARAIHDAYTRSP